MLKGRPQIIPDFFNAPLFRAKSSTKFMFDFRKLSQLWVPTVSTYMLGWMNDMRRSTVLALVLKNINWLFLESVGRCLRSIAWVKGPNPPHLHLTV